MSMPVQNSIGRKILASFLAIFVCTYAATALFVYNSARNSVARAEADGLRRFAEEKAGRIDSDLKGLATNLSAWKSLEVMNDVVTGDVDRRVARTLQELKQQYQLSGDIFVFDRDGKLIAGSDEAAAATTPLQLPPVWQINTDDISIVDKHTDPVSGATIVAFVSRIHASFASDMHTGMMVITLPWARFQDLLQEPDINAVIWRSSDRAVLLDSARQLGATLPDGLFDQTASLEVALASGSYVAGASREMIGPAQSWRIAVLKPTSDAYAQIDQIALQLVALGGLLSVPMVIAVYVLARRLTAPIESLKRVVTGITESGDLSRRADLSSKDELGALATAFNLMAGNLQRTSSERERVLGDLEALTRTLEQRVSDRTKDLASSNAELTRTIAQLRTAQSQLVQSEKMASLGQLVAGVAHELNNPIGFIYANFPHLEEYARDLLNLISDIRKLPLPDDIKAKIEARVKELDLDFVQDDILKIIQSGKSGATRVKEIVSSLRSFSRLDEAELKSVRLEDGIDDTLAILQHHTKNRIKIEKDFQLNRPVTCFAGQINQVFMNIIYNGIQAISGPGTIRIATAQDGDDAVVTIADSGKGIPPDIISKIFDPFFTTKKVGEGTGLGLSISYGIIEKHGGKISVASVPGEGTTFTIRIKINPQNPGQK